MTDKQYLRLIQWGVLILALLFFAKFAHAEPATQDTTFQTWRTIPNLEWSHWADDTIEIQMWRIIPLADSQWSNSTITSATCSTYISHSPSLYAIRLHRVYYYDNALDAFVRYRPRPRNSPPDSVLAELRYLN